LPADAGSAFVSVGTRTFHFVGMAQDAGHLALAKTPMRRYEIMGQVKRHGLPT